MDTSNRPYVHGYDAREAIRLQDQASSLVELLHADTRYGSGERVLEAGCGVGAQTVTLARTSPTAAIVSLDVSASSLAAARAATSAARLANVEFLRADLFALPFADACFDHAFVCFVLEHLAEPGAALRALRRVVRPGGTITVIEGDHGSAYFHPRSAYAERAIACLVELQRQGGGDALIGRRLHPLLTAAGLVDVRVSPRMVYVDATRPALVEGFTKRTFTAMVEGVRGPAIATGMIDADVFGRGIRDLERTAADDGVFCYTFFKAVAVNPG